MKIEWINNSANVGRLELRVRQSMYSGKWNAMVYLLLNPLGSHHEFESDAAAREWCEAWVRDLFAPALAAARAEEREPASDRRGALRGADPDEARRRLARVHGRRGVEAVGARAARGAAGMSETGTERVCEQCGRAFNAGKSWSKFCSSACKVRAFRARNRSESDLERLLPAALDAVRRGITEGPALSALRRALVVAPTPEEQIPPPAPAVAEQPAKVKPAKVKPSTKPAPVVAEPIAEQPAPKSARRVCASSKGGA